MQEGARDESGGGIPNSTYFPYLIFIMSEGMSNLSNGFRGIERVFFGFRKSVGHYIGLIST